MSEKKKRGGGMTSFEAHRDHLSFAGHVREACTLGENFIFSFIHGTFIFRVLFGWLVTLVYLMG